MSGDVIFAGLNGAFGYSVKIDAGNGLVAMVAHLRFWPRISGPVERGQVIGIMGGTGTGGTKQYNDHIHFQVYFNGKSKSFVPESIPEPASGYSGFQVGQYTSDNSPSNAPGFDFAIDALTVDGNLLGGGNPDGVADFLDDFNDGSLTVLPTSAFSCSAPVNESGGFLNLRSADGANSTSTPGVLIDHCFLGQNGPPFRFQDGAGGAVITASFRADAPLRGQGYGLQLFTAAAGNEIVNIQVGFSDSGPVLHALVRPANQPAITETTHINLIGLERIHLRLVFDDATNRVTHFYSTDGLNFVPIVTTAPGTIMTAGSQAITSMFGVVSLSP
jgi:hypothetical protein